MRTFNLVTFFRDMLLIPGLIVAAALWANTAMAASDEPVTFRINADSDLQFSFTEGKTWHTATEAQWHEDIDSLKWSDTKGNRYMLTNLGTVIELNKDNDNEIRNNPHPEREVARFWRGDDNKFYTLSVDGTLLVSTDGDQWRRDLNNMWVSNGTAYAFDNNMNLLVSHDSGRNWVPNSDNRWMVSNGMIYDYDRINGVITIVQDERQSAIPTHLPARGFVLNTYDLTEMQPDDAVDTRTDMWRDERGFYYQIGTNGNLWISEDGDNWKESVTNVWQADDDRFYKLDANNILWVSADQEDWTVAQSQTWDSLNFTYWVDANGNVYYRRDA